MADRKQERSAPSCDRIGFAAFCGIATVGWIDLIRYIALGALTPFVAILIIETLFVLIAYIAWRGRFPWLFLAVTAAEIVLFVNTTYTELEPFNLGFLIQAIFGGIAAVSGMVFALREKQPRRPFPWRPAALAAAILAVFLGTWWVCSHQAKTAVGNAQRELWAVPEQFDAQDCQQAGTVEELIYETKAYATDERAVEKRALVYLPYGYDESQSYNILYLMHGTGDDENYWLGTHSYNKTMLDQMIASGDIEPLIVVTPTFYVEDDCADELDLLTYSFREELRNDLMPAVESQYATYAERCDDAGFTASREHRAFAGLSRGAVTTYHSVFCGSLDYFAWFGTFSGSRTDAEYFQQTIQSEAFADYPIRYLYVSSGIFDFALVGQLQDYEALLETEPRLTYGVNTMFDIFPMRYHSIGSWHLALYNFLQKIF